LRAAAGAEGTGRPDGPGAAGRGLPAGRGGDGLLGLRLRPRNRAAAVVVAGGPVLVVGGRTHLRVVALWPQDRRLREVTGIYPCRQGQTTVRFRYDNKLKAVLPEIGQALVAMTTKAVAKLDISEPATRSASGTTTRAPAATSILPSASAWNCS